MENNTNNPNQNENQDINKVLKETYTAESFGGETGLLAVREDASRHIQRTDKDGIFNMFTEILDNSLDESVELMARLKAINPNIVLDPLEIKISINQKEGICIIEDQGRGLTIEMNEKHQLPTCCAVYERDNTGSKGRKSGATNKGYTSKTMGVHGAGAFVVTACSEYITVQTRVYNEQRKCVEIYEWGCREGVPIEEESRVHRRLKYIGDDHTIIGNGRNNTGVRTEFKPDLKIMSLYNPRTQQIDNDYYTALQIKKRIVDTLYTIEDPVIVTLSIDGVVDVYDSRNLSYTYNKVEGEHYLRMILSPDDEMRNKMAIERVSDFYLDLIIMPLEDYNEANKYEAFVNRIKVIQSSHLNTIRYQMSNEFGRKCNEDDELRGFYRSDQMKGIKIIPLLYVDQAEWGGQVKSDYNDARVADYMGKLISKMKAFGPDGYFKNLIDYCFACSKPWLLAERNKSEEMARFRQEQDKKERAIKEDRKLKEKLNEDLRYLNKKGMFLFTNDVQMSDVVIVEGKSAGNMFGPIMSKMPNLAVFTGMQGKIDNANKLDPYNHKSHITLEEKEKANIDVTIPDRLDVIFSSPFARFLFMTDNDADGAHMTALLRFYVWKRHRHIIEEGRVYDIKPQYCDYFASEDNLTYEYKGVTKTLAKSGYIKTIDEYEIIRKMYSDKIKFKLFKGVGSVASSDIYRILNNAENWSQVPPLTPEEEYQIDKMFTDSSLFKKVFTEVNYMDDSAIRKDRVKKTVYKDTSILPQDIVNAALISDYPIFTSVSRKCLEDYEQMGSAVIEVDALKRQLEEVKQEWGTLY